MFEQELSNYWKTVVNTLQDGVLIVDIDGTIVSVNKAFENITGYSQTDVLGESCTLLNCNTCKMIREKKGDGHWCSMFKSGALKMHKCVLRCRDGGYVHVVKNAAVLKDTNGKVIGAVETITDITDLMKKEIQIEGYRRELQAEDRFFGIIGSSSPIQRVTDLIVNASQSDAPVIIYGESGTGKELVAKAIHESGTRKQKTFVKVNCAALNESLLESELFGHVKGAFTGAHRSREGRFEAARGGDIFLDEVGDLPLSTQVKLLRVLEEKVVERVGDNRPIDIDVRIISATNKDLLALAAEGLFRQDFYYRINVIPIWVPPLRERIGDIPLLAESFFRRIHLKSDKGIKGISNEAMELLMHHPWPGNVRELKSAFEYAFVACPQGMIAPNHLPSNIFNQHRPADIRHESAESLEEIKKRRLIEALERTAGNQSRAARILGISRTSVWNQIKRFGL